MTIRQCLAKGREILEKAGSETPYLDAVILLGYLLGVKKYSLMAMMDEGIPETAEARFSELIERRGSGVPIAYLIGQKDFHGQTFQVSSDVLVPRPDTEILVDEAYKIIRDKHGIRRIHDAFSGSGCVAIALKLAMPSIEISASDVSPKAIDVLQENARVILGYELEAYRCDLLTTVPGNYDMITANPPYVSSAETDAILERGWGEPRLALDGGPDGLDVIRRFLPQAFSKLEDGGWLLMEGGAEQHAEIRELMAKAGFTDLYTVPDLAGRPRVTRGMKP
jgi:release factor glutamine methyltransferase